MSRWCLLAALLVAIDIEAVTRFHSSTPEEEAAAAELIAERCQQCISEKIGLRTSTQGFAVSILVQVYIIHRFYCKD